MLVFSVRITGHILFSAHLLNNLRDLQNSSASFMSSHSCFFCFAALIIGCTLSIIASGSMYPREKSDLWGGGGGGWG